MSRSFELTFTTTEIAEMFEITPRTLRWYNDLGILQPDAKDSKKRYTPREVENLKTIQALRSAGYSPTSIKALLLATTLMPAEPRSTEEAMRLALAAAVDEEQTIVVGTDQRRYNTNYKRLRRIADNLGFTVVMHLEDGLLRFRARPSR